MRLWLVMVLMLVVAGPALADDLPAAGGPSLPMLGGESHGWLAMPLSDPRGGGAVVHLPPRRASGRKDTVDDAVPGGVRLALRLPQMPERLAAWGPEVWIAFSPEPMGNRRVLSMSVERAALGGSWASSETEGRLPSLASLPPGDLIGFVGTDHGPVALLARGTLGAVLLGVRSGEWEFLGLPAEAAAGANADQQHLWLISDAAGVCLANDATGTVWRGTFHAASLADGTTIPVLGWAASSFVWTIAGRGPASVDFGPVMASGQLVYGARNADGSVELLNPGRVACRVLARVPGVTGPAALVPLDQVGRVALAWLQASSPASRAAAAGRAPTMQIAEVSAQTGAVAYRGGAQVAGPVSATELKVLAVVLVLVMAVVLLIVLRPEAPTVELSMPEGYALAEPGRRVIAAGIDFVIAVVVAAAVFGIRPQELLSPSLLLYNPGGLGTLSVVVAAGIVTSTIAEWLMGGSIGKLITGLRVLRIVMKTGAVVGPEVRRPGLWGAFVRNAIRWTLPPVAISGMNAPNYRHRGDLAAGTVVVTAVQPAP